MIVHTLTWSESLILFILSAMLILPGWAFISITGLWGRWKTLQRWCVAIGLSIAFYPVLYYWARIVVPGTDLGVNKLTVMLVILGMIAFWGLRKNFKEQFSFEPSEWIAIGVFLATLFTRVWFAHLHPYPAWSDSLHHTLLTQLTAQHGGLPFSLEPYEPVPLGMYHLGLYAITAPVQLLSRVPAHTALLWTAQVLNGLCTLGIYLVLDRKVGRNAALVGSVVVGLLSFQPAWYVNWGRFTQVASQSILLIAWVVTWEAIRDWAMPGNRQWMGLVALTISSAMLTASVFLLHFRVAGFYLPLLVITVIWEMYCGLKCRKIGRAILGTAIIGFISIFYTFPAILSALRIYFAKNAQVSSSTSLAENSYYQGATLDSIFQIGIQPWLFYIALVGLVILLIRKNKFGFAMLAWLISLWMIANVYRLNYPLLVFTNAGAVVIMLYLPVSLIIGAATDHLLGAIPCFWKNVWHVPAIVLVCVAGFIGGQIRLNDVEDYRFFLNDDDIAAMNWIRENTPEDAVFAINTYMWLGTSPHGIDGGYWIPYFTGRKTTTGTMLFSLTSDRNYKNQVISWSTLINQIDEREEISSYLCSEAVDYFYMSNTNLAVFEKTAYDLDGTVVFENDKVRILECK